MFKTKKRRLTAVGSAIALVAVVAAVAYFTDTGTGTKQASVGSSTPWGVTFTATTGTMYPGAGTSTIHYTITNNGSGHQNLNATSATVVDDGSGNIEQNGTPLVGCLSTWFSAADNSPAPADVAPGGNVTGTADITMTNAAVSQDDCQGATPDIQIDAS
jgi:hypothetical protein